MTFSDGKSAKLQSSGASGWQHVVFWTFNCKHCFKKHSQGKEEGIPEAVDSEGAHLV